MTHEQFVVWLHGFFEISDAKELNEKQVQVIKDHLDLFFKKESPDRDKKTIQIDPSLGMIKENPMTLITHDFRCTCKTVNNIACPIHGWGGLGIGAPGNDQIIC